jgi:hypothetical protein
VEGGVTEVKKEKNWLVLAFGLVATGCVLFCLSPFWIVGKLEAESGVSKSQGKGGNDEK